MSATFRSRRDFLTFAGLALAATTAAPFAASAAPTGEEWVLLGTERVGKNPERDVISVGRRDGHFERIMFKVYGNDVRVGDVKVVFGNGQSDHLNVRELIRDGQSSGVFHVPGHDRVIERVELIYQSEHTWRRSATVEVYGQLSRASTGPIGDVGWEVLGMQAVAFHVDHDTIAVGADKGRFRSVKLNVQDHDIYLYNVRVTFGSGEMQEFAIDGLIRGGTGTRELDLRGDRRRVAKIDLVYRTRPGFHGRAHVTVLGKH